MTREWSTGLAAARRTKLSFGIDYAMRLVFTNVILLRKSTLIDRLYVYLRAWLYIGTRGGERRT
jgi:hypothetical protein